ncbi:hypothetical protein Tco_1133143 [Tanacetum coccineum]|uniref:Uncharacterized protein n=1 Tax=Tanacetum coccineum TaxID=301880 RepID=A0ABQ5JDW0_9ASTR
MRSFTPDTLKQLADEVDEYGWYYSSNPVSYIRLQRDDTLVAPADRLKIGKCNLRLGSDITSKEATLQVVYDVLKLTPFYKAFQVTADAPEIYMQEFWASAYVHNRSDFIISMRDDSDMTLKERRFAVAKVQVKMAKKTTPPNQYAEALSSIPSTVDQYLAHNQAEASGRCSELKSDIQRQLYTDLVEAYAADKILLDTYGDTVTIKRPRDGADDDEHPPLEQTGGGPKRRRVRKGTRLSTSAPSATTTKTAGTTTDVFERSADQEFETGIQDEQEEEEVQHVPDWFQQPTRLPSPDHAWEISCSPAVKNSPTWLSKTWHTQDLGVVQITEYQMDRRLVPKLNVSQTIVKYDSKFALWGGLAWGQGKPTTVLCICSFKEYSSESIPNDVFLSSSGSVEDIQLGVESYQRNINSPSPIRTDHNLRKRSRCFSHTTIQEDSSTRIKQEENRLCEIDELHNYKAVRLRFSDPMIQPEPEGSTQGYPLVRVEVLRLCNMVVEVPVFQLAHKCQSVKVKNFKKDATLKLFKNGMSMLVQKSQVHKMAKLQVGIEIMLG